MSRIVTISLSDEVVLNSNYIDLKSSRKLSKHINNLLTIDFNVKRSEIPREVKDIDSELQEINVRRALLLEKKKDHERREEEERKKYPAEEGWYKENGEWVKRFESKAKRFV